MTESEAITFFRTSVVEFYAAVVSDATIQSFIQRGLEATNEAVGYYVKDAPLVSVANKQEYLLPTDYNSPVFHEWNTGSVIESAGPATFLDNLDIQTMRKDGLNWRTAAPDIPTKYYLINRTLGLYPPPLLGGVKLTLRHVANPPDFATFGFAGMGDEDTRIPLWYAIGLWSAMRPDSQQALARAKAMDEKFQQEVTGMKARYEARKLKR